MHTYIHTYIHSYIHTYIHIYIHTFISFIYTYKHTYIYTYIHKNIYLTCSCRSALAGCVSNQPAVKLRQLVRVKLRRWARLSYDSVSGLSYDMNAWSALIDADEASLTHLFVCGQVSDWRACGTPRLLPQYIHAYMLNQQQQTCMYFIVSSLV